MPRHKAKTGGRRKKLDYLKTLARVSYFVESGEPFTLEQVATSLGEHWRTAHRYLIELRALGFEVEVVQIGKLRRLRGKGKLTIEKAIARVLKECRDEAADAARTAAQDALREFGTNNY